MPIKRGRKGRVAPVQGKKINYDGMTFASGLERYCYMKLKENKLFEGYENETFTLIEGFTLGFECYERQANEKGDFINRGSGKKIQGITYTPDFVGRDYIIEVKGRADFRFPMRWKLFKLWLTKNDIGKTIYKPQCKTEIDKVVKLILEKRKNK